MPVYMLSHNTARQRAKDAIDAAPDGHRVAITEPRRSMAQNDMLHPLIRIVTRKGELEYDGRKLTQDEWRRLFVISAKIELGHEVKLVSSIGRQGIMDVTDSSSKTLSKKMFSAVIDQVKAFGDMYGDPVPAHKLDDVYNSGEYVKPKQARMTA